MKYFIIGFAVTLSALITGDIILRKTLREEKENV